MDLRSSGTLPLEQVTKPKEFVDSMSALWSDDARRDVLGRQARAWVSEYYSWMAPARDALAAFKRGRC
jgi:glycosyltransferase involved in cell wall biosynthesis